MTAESWRERAACLGRAPMFDATIDDGGRYHGEGEKARKKRYEEAKAICAKCTVTAECKADTLRGRDEGVRFGKVLPQLSRPQRSAA